MNENLKTLLFILTFICFAAYVIIVRLKVMLVLKKKYGVLFSEGKLSDEDKELVKNAKLKTFIATAILVLCFIILIIITRSM